MEILSLYLLVDGNYQNLPMGFEVVMQVMPELPWDELPEVYLPVDCKLKDGTGRLTLYGVDHMGRDGDTLYTNPIVLHTHVIYVHSSCLETEEMREARVNFNESRQEGLEALQALGELGEYGYTESDLENIYRGNDANR